MEKTKQLMQMFAEMRAVPGAEAIETEHSAGVSAAKAAIESGEPFRLMDECNFDELKKAYATGWNCTWFIAT